MSVNFTTISPPRLGSGWSIGLDMSTRWSEHWNSEPAWDLIAGRCRESSLNLRLLCVPRKQPTSRHLATAFRTVMPYGLGHIEYYVSRLQLQLGLIPHRQTRSRERYEFQTAGCDCKKSVVLPSSPPSRHRVRDDYGLSTRTHRF